MPFKDPAKRKESKRYESSRYQRRKAEGRCVSCSGPERAEGKLVCERCSETGRRAALRYARSLRIEAYQIYGSGKCVCCGEARHAFLTIDHINNDGAEHKRQRQREKVANNICSWLKKHGWPAGFRVLCHNCNSGRWRNGGVCPHEEERAAKERAP